MVRRLGLWAVLLGTSGCGSFMAARMVQAPNTYPTWLAPVAPVELDFASGLLTNFPVQYYSVAAPAARLRYRVVEPADYQFKATATNWVEQGRGRSLFTFAAKFPGIPTAWTGHPRGTVFLLHGYGVGMFAMSPWSLQLAEEGWRCVLVDLRGHGRSTGKHIYYGLQEAKDLRGLLDELAREGKIAGPVAAVGHSYGAVTALRWRTEDQRVKTVVALAPYRVLGDAVVNICRQYSSWLPEWLLHEGLNSLPAKLGTGREELDALTLIRRSPEPTLFVAGAADNITPARTVQELFSASALQSEFLVVSNATHEALPYFFPAIEPVLADWLVSASTLAGRHAAAN